MILILSENQDQSTNNVIDWITYLGKDFIRINGNDDCGITSIILNENSTTSDITLTIDNKEIKFSKISAYWYRRGNFSIKSSKCRSYNSDIIRDDINANLYSEIRAVSNFLHYSLKSKKSIGSYFDNNVNKLENLQIAKECGLNIPKTFISSEKNKIIDIINSNDEIITKAISETIMFKVEDKGTIQAYTNTVKLDDIETFDATLFPSLFQVNISKKYELRIFYLDNVLYPMAIFSQTTDQTKTDFRNYDKVKPNRCVPYKLPLSIECKINSFMKRKGYTSGSIDMIVSKNNEYVFLEINPIGQFGMTSIPCNYYIDKIIAEYLCKEI